MESLSRTENSNADKEEGELSDDDDDSSNQKRSVKIVYQDVGRRSRRGNVDAGQSRNVKRHRSRSLLRNRRQECDDPRRYSYESPARGCGKDDILCHDLQQKLPERRKSAFSRLQRNLCLQERRVSSQMRAAFSQNRAPSRNITFLSRKRILPSENRAHSSKERIFPSDKRALTFKKIAFSSQKFKHTQDELRRLEQEQKEIKRQLKMLEEEEKSMEQYENEIQTSGYDSLLDVFENLNKETEDEKENLNKETENEKENQNKETEDEKKNLPVPKAHSGPPCVNKDLNDLVNSLNAFNGLTACEEMTTTISFSSDKEATASLIVTPNQIPVHYSSCRENNARILPHVRVKPYVNNHSISTYFDFGVSGRSTPKPKQTYGTDRQCPDKVSFCLPYPKPSPKKMKTFSPAVIQMFENAPEDLIIHGKGCTRSCDSDEEDAESLRVKLLEDVKEKRKTMAEWPAKEIEAVHESTYFDSSLMIIDGDDLAVEQQDIVRVPPAVLTVSQEDRNSVNLCQDSSQHLNDHQEQPYLVNLCKMKLTAEDWSHKAQSQCTQQPLTCSLSSSVSTTGLQLDLNTASTSALKEPRMILEEIAQVTVPKSSVFPNEIVKICTQKESQCSTSSLESVDAEADTKCLKKPSVSSQKDIHKSACSSDVYEHMSSIKPVVVSSVTECLNKTDIEGYCAKQPETVDTNIKFSQSDKDGVVSKASLSPVGVQETHSVSDLVLLHSEFQTASFHCPSKSTRKMLEFATSSSYLLSPAVITTSSASHSSQINKMSNSKGRPLLTEFAKERTPIECMTQLSPSGSAAQSAAGSAAQSAAGSEAQSTAGSAAHQSAAGSAAQSAAGSAAQSATGSAAQSAAGSTVHQSAAGSAAQLFPLKCSAHQFPTSSTTQISATEFIVQLSTTEPTAQISPVESTSQLNLVESTVQISAVESTPQQSTAESIAQLSVVESMTQITPTKLLSSLSISQIPLTMSTALMSSAACHVTSDLPVGQSSAAYHAISDLPVGQSSNSYSSSSTAFSRHPHKVAVSRKPRKCKKHFRLPVHPKVIIQLSPSSDSNDDDDQRKTQTLEVTDSMKALHTLEDQNTSKPDHVDRILNEQAERTSQMLRDSEQKLASLEELMQTHQREVHLLTEKEANIQKDVQQKEKELGHLRSQLIPLKHEITNRNNVVMLYKSEIEKTQKEVQRLGKWKDQYPANKTGSELSASAADTTTVISRSAGQSQVSSADRTEQRAQERQKLLEREKKIKETLEILRKNVPKTGTRISPFASRRLRNAQSKRNLRTINRVPKTHILPQ
ncbi:hypothetical protein BsWGS_12322 [Bradybaena similaris]